MYYGMRTVDSAEKAERALWWKEFAVQALLPTLFIILGGYGAYLFAGADSSYAAGLCLAGLTLVTIHYFARKAFVKHSLDTIKHSTDQLRRMSEDLK